LGITAYIIYVVFHFIDNLLKDKLEEIFNIDIPGLGLAVIFLFLVVVGIIGQSILARPFKDLFKRIIEKTPLLKLIFSALNDLFSAFVGKEKKFNKPVMVLVNPISNLEKLGFLTEEDLSSLDEKEKVAVYFPHSYNFSGELFIVPKNQVRPIDINPSVVMKFIISGGVSGVYEDKETAND
jgi:uncharacterized membrane protein